MRAWMIFALLAGCGGPVTVSISIDPAKYVPAWAEDAPALEARTIAAAKVAIEVWGRDEHALDGWDILLTNSPISLPDGSRETGESDPYWSGGGTIRIDITNNTLTVPPCIEATVLAHEVGHLAISGHDPDHVDPRWRDHAFTAQMVDALIAIVPQDDPYCMFYLSWPGVSGLAAPY